MASTIVTVPSGISTSVSLSYANSATASLATSLLSAVYTAATGSKLVVDPPTTTASTVSGYVNEFIISAAGAYTMPAGFDTVIDTASGAVTLTGNNDAGEKIVAGDSASLYFSGGTGTGTIVGGSGSATIAGGTFSALGDTNYLDKTFTSGTVGSNSTIVLTTSTTPAAPASATVSGTGNTLYTGGAGSYNVVYDTSGGANTIVAGLGASTINATASGGFYYDTGGFLQYNGSVTSTIVGGGASNIVAIGGTGISFYGNTGTGEIFAAPGTSATPYLYASSGITVVYGTTGDNLNLVGPGGSNALVAGAGNETLNSFYSSTSLPDYIFDGSGSDFVISSPSAATVLYAGSGSATMVGGTAATDYFVFSSGLTSPGGGTNVIYNWNSADQLLLAGYTGGTAAEKLAAAGTVSNGILNITLPDSTKIQILGVSSVNAQYY